MHATILDKSQKPASLPIGIVNEFLSEFANKCADECTRRDPDVVDFVYNAAKTDPRNNN